MMKLPLSPTFFVKFLIYLLVSTSIFADPNVLVSKLQELEIEELEIDYSAENSLEFIQKDERISITHDLNLLLKAKFKIINGDLSMADFYLNQINNRTTHLLRIKNRYLGLIEFIKGNFNNSIQYLNDANANSKYIHPNTCLLRLLNYMATNQNQKLRSEFRECTTHLEKFSKNNQYWLDIMYKLKMTNWEGIKKDMITDVERTLHDDEMSRIWLKSGLYLNKEKDLLKILNMLSEKNYESKKIREIIALIYLRDGDKEKALQFVDDIESANAENIKGNINLMNKQNELAFGHFKLALQKKADSENALERGLPLSWALGQFEDGLVMLNNISNKNLDKRKSSALKIAFLIRLKKFEEAYNELLILKNEFQNVLPFEVGLMDSYLNMMNALKEKKYDKRKSDESSENACKAFDGLSCWIAMSHIHWDNLGMTIKRDDEILSDAHFKIEEMKNKKEIKPLKENPLIDQRDIEELDSELVQIRPIN